MYNTALSLLKYKPAPKALLPDPRGYRRFLVVRNTGFRDYYSV